MTVPSLLENGAMPKTRTALETHGVALATLSFQTLGIVYSDLGTSPLYVLNGIWPSSGSAPSEEDVIGGVSAIIWSLTLLPLLKYIFISMHFGTSEGEGGPFALFQGLYPPEQKDLDKDRVLTGESYTQPSRDSGTWFKNVIQVPLLVWSLLGTALTMSDGVFTTAVSVTSAVGGIAVAKPSVEEQIIPISIALILVLFIGQQLGTAKLSLTFAPIAFIWFLLLVGTGIYNISTYPGIFRAFDPSRAVLLFVRTRDYDLLAGILLALTGCEATFANLGQFNAASIRLSFCCFVYPGLILAYLGQGARLIVDGDNVVQNAFYRSIPGSSDGPLFWIMFVIAILATFVASQAMISATFSLLQQVINMKSFPPLRMHYTSETNFGHVYIPALNWVMMIITVIVVGVFSNLTNLSNAYGFAVATVMFSTTVLLSISMYYLKRWPIIVAISFFFVFGFFDGLFWGAALKKVPEGAWVPLMIGVIMMCVMAFWTWAKGLEDGFDGANRQNLRHFLWKEDKPSLGDEVEVDEDDENHDSISYYYQVPIQKALSGKAEDLEKRKLIRIPTMAIFHKLTTGGGVPHTFIGFVRQYPALPQILIFLSVSMLPVPRVAVEDRYAVVKTKTLEGCYGVTYYIGFRERSNVKIDELVESICKMEMEYNPENFSRIIQNLKTISANGATHVVPHYHVLSKKVDAGYLSTIVNWVRTTLIEDIYRRLATMFPETANWLTSADEIIHIGINATI
ncbi:potassium transporter [Gymnopus androsaceus JB14]|uniref:Potassium transporter n=1 Tax=Gymnopus androsaceus JB14 TaxID=1447944 RepID=A0A6A4IF63_9AGAR|nr:potassium transporter [Gymnopus androsaceus JB14]